MWPNARSRWGLYRRRPAREGQLRRRHGGQGDGESRWRKRSNSRPVAPAAAVVSSALLLEPIARRAAAGAPLRDQIDRRVHLERRCARDTLLAVVSGGGQHLQRSATAKKQ
eukprot:224293-Pleurochrysis_carterae.AAC.7